MRLSCGSVSHRGGTCERLGAVKLWLIVLGNFCGEKNSAKRETLRIPRSHQGYFLGRHLSVRLRHNTALSLLRQAGACVEDWRVFSTVCRHRPLLPLRLVYHHRVAFFVGPLSCFAVCPASSTCSTPIEFPEKMAKQI